MRTGFGPQSPWLFVAVTPCKQINVRNVCLLHLNKLLNAVWKPFSLLLCLCPEFPLTTCTWQFSFHHNKRGRLQLALCVV